MSGKIKLATVWLDGCSGCHMSLLDMDERLIELAQSVDVVYGPLVDTKEFPEDVDVTLVEGAVSQRGGPAPHPAGPIAHQDAGLAGRLRGDRQRARDAQPVRRRCRAAARLPRERYTEPQMPREIVPPLLAAVRPVHEVVTVDVLRARLPAAGGPDLLRAQRPAGRADARPVGEGQFG